MHLSTAHAMAQQQKWQKLGRDLLYQKISHKKECREKRSCGSRTSMTADMHSSSGKIPCLEMTYPKNCRDDWLKVHFSQFSCSPSSDKSCTAERSVDDDPDDNIIQVVPDSMYALKKFPSFFETQKKCRWKAVMSRHSSCKLS